MSLNAFGLDEHLQWLRSQQLLRHTQTVESGVNPEVIIDGQRYLNFSSNDYLGMATHPEVLAVLNAKISNVGAGAAHLMTGHSIDHHILEQQLAKITGYECAMLFSSGYMANMGVIDALLRIHPQGVVYHDRFNHASLLDGARLAGVRTRRFPHQNINQLAQWLSADSAVQKLIVSDAIFSMDGTSAPIEALQHLAGQYHAALMIDDAHGFGIRSTPYPVVDVYMATLGKAVGCFGAFVAGSASLIEYLRNQARTYMFSTAFPPILARAASRALMVLDEDPSIRVRLADNIALLRQEIGVQGWQIIPADTAIIPIMVGSPERALALSAHLRAQSILALPIRPPTVPKDQCRLRITVSASHKPEHMERLLHVLGQVRHLYDANDQALT